MEKTPKALLPPSLPTFFLLLLPNQFFCILKKHTHTRTHWRVQKCINHSNWLLSSNTA